MEQDETKRGPIAENLLNYCGEFLCYPEAWAVKHVQVGKGINKLYPKIVTLVME